MPLSFPLVVTNLPPGIISIPEFPPMGVCLVNVLIFLNPLKLTYLQDLVYLSRLSNPIIILYTFGAFTAIFLLNVSALLLGLRASYRLQKKPERPERLSSLDDVRETLPQGFT